MHDSLSAEVARALRSSFLPTPFARLLDGGYLAAVWPQLAPSVETEGFIESARYMADMALDAVLPQYQPVADRAALLRGGLSAGEIDAVAATLDVLQLVQPQLLLLLAALAEARDRPGPSGGVGGGGRPAPRATTERERTHLAADLALVPSGRSPLPVVAATLGVPEAPDLYRAVARWPAFLDASWAELQHLDAYPPLRDRARGLYYYARDAARFLARPLRADRVALAAAGVSEAAQAAAAEAIDAALPVAAAMLLHCSAMRVALGITAPEVADRG